MKDLIQDLLPKYNLADRNGKTEITLCVVETILSRGGRFLRGEKRGNQEHWVEETFESSRQKVGHTIRDMNKKIRETTP